MPDANPNKSPFTVPALWLGPERGYLTDWVTQRWVCVTGRRVNLREQAWLDGPAGDPRIIGEDFFDVYARRHGLVMHRGDPDAGLLPDFAGALGPRLAAALDPRVVAFYEHTARYDMDVWSRWQNAFRPFGWLIMALFARRLCQLNLPLDPLDTCRGMDSEVVTLADPRTGAHLWTGWLRRMKRDGRVVYSGCYGTATPPRAGRPCVKVVFPLPNGSAMVFLRPRIGPGRSLRLVSAGRGFGDAGFYFIVRRGPDEARVRYVRTMREIITLFVDEEGVLRTEHDLNLWRSPFLHLHYRLTPKARDKDGT